MVMEGRILSLIEKWIWECENAIRLWNHSEGSKRIRREGIW